VSFLVCVHLPRFPLTVAVDGREDLLGAPVALAPVPGGVQRIGEVSPAAQAAGVRPGLSLGEALARCPALRLLPPDPVAAERRWQALVERLEAIGAAVEASGEPGAVEPDPGTAWFQAATIRRLHGGTLDGVLAATRAAIGLPVRIGVGPTRFLARVAAGRARSRRAMVLPAAAPPRLGAAPVGGLPVALRDEPVATLAVRPDLAPLVEPLERLGIGTLGALAGLSRGALGERFGRPGIVVHELLHGVEPPLRPRERREPIDAELRLPEAASGEQLRHALGVLVDRVLAHPRRRHRPLRAVLLQAALVERGTWQERVVLREAMADPQRIRLALGLRLGRLPSPAERLALRVEALGAPLPADVPLLGGEDPVRRARLQEAVRQVREAAGHEGALRVVEVDPGSRIAERRMALAPFEVG